MKKLLVLLVLLLCISGCEKPKTIEDLRNELAENPGDINISAELIDLLLLDGQKEEAYQVLLDTKEYITSEEDINVLKEHIDNMPIRLVEIDHYYNGSMINISNYLYDENGRIVSDGNFTYIYPDDGGNVYYYTLSSYYEDKTAYDKEGNEVYSPSGKSAVEYDSDGRISKVVTPLSYSDGSKIENFTYDNSGKVISQITDTDYGATYKYHEETSYKYDDEDRLIKKTTNYTSGEVKYVTLVVNKYDDNGDLISEVTEDTSTWSDGYTTSIVTRKYEYIDHKVTHSTVEYIYNDSYRYSSNTGSETWYEIDDHGNIVKETCKSVYYDGTPYTNTTEYTYEYDPIYDVILSKKTKYSYTNSKYSYVDKYIYELVKPDSSHVGLTSLDAITFVSGDATRAVIQREITASNIKIRSTPEISDNNQVGKVQKGEIYYVYDSVYNDGYAWHQIGINQWIADDGTWTEIINQ